MARLRCATIACLALMAGLPAVEAQEGAGLRADLKPLTASGRTGGPRPVVVTFDNSASGLVEGRLQVIITSGGESVCCYESHPLALTSGEQSFRMTLPPFTLSGPDSWAMLGLSFVTGDEVVHLGERQVSAPTDLRRSFLIAVCRPAEEPVGADDALVRGLLLERFDPDLPPPLERSYRCVPGTVAPKDMPALSAGYCAYDVVFLTGDGLRALQGRQLDALYRWVAGGGSVCVMTTDRLGEGHVRFLNALAGGAVPAFRVDEEGALVAARGAQTEGVSMHRCGIGRAVIVQPTSGAWPTDESAEWRAAAAFLWKVRSVQAEQLAREGCWRADLQRDWPWPRDRYSRGLMQVSLDGPPSFRPMPNPECGNSLIRLLEPAGVRILPVWLVFGLFAAFALVVGPLDYLILGALRLRRLTWVLFPLASVACAGLLVMLSAHYLGMGGHRASLCIVDVGPDGEIARRTRYALSFSARAMRLVVPVRNGLLAPMDVLGMASQYYGNRGRGTGSLRVGPPWYVGHVPAAFEVVQGVPQWTPAVQRTLSFEAADTPLEPDWDAVDVQDLASVVRRMGVRNRLLPDVDLPVAVFVLHAGNIRPLGSAEGVVPPEPSAHLRGQRYDLTFLHRLSMPSQIGPFSVLSQLSPAGSGGFEDLALLDPTDGSQWLVMVVVRDGGDYYVYRRLYYGES